MGERAVVRDLLLPVCSAEHIKRAEASVATRSCVTRKAEKFSGQVLGYRFYVDVVLERQDVDRLPLHFPLRAGILSALFYHHL